MNTEYEIRVLEIDKEKLIKKLEELGAEFKGDNEQKKICLWHNSKGRW